MYYKCVLSLILKYTQDIHIFMGTIGLLIPKDIGIDIKIVNLARTDVSAKFLISMAAILNVS